MTFEDGFMIVKMPMLDKPKPSGTGKTLAIANTGPYVKVKAQYKGDDVKIKVHAYVPNPAYIKPE